MMYGSKQYNSQSRFIGEIKDEDLDIVASTAPKSSTSFLDLDRLPFAKKSQAKAAQPAKIHRASKAAGAVGAEKKGWHPGDQVEHKSWGKGVVIKVTGSGEDMELDIAFASKGNKRLLAAFAPIKKI